MNTKHGWQHGPNPSYMTHERTPPYADRQSPYPVPGERRSSYSYYPRDAALRASPPYRDEYPASHGDQRRPDRSPPPHLVPPDRGDHWRPTSESRWQRPDTMAQTMASRMFEPSESWKQSHSDLPPRPQFAGPSRDYDDRRLSHYRDAYGLPLARDSAGYDYSPPQYSGDRYQASHNPRDHYDLASRRRDSYRPDYDVPGNVPGGSRLADFREYSPPTDNHAQGFRRDPRILEYNRRPSPQYADYVDSRGAVRERSVSGSSRGGPASPSGILRNPTFRPSDGGARATSGVERSSHTTPSRASRASIESTASSSRKRPRSRSSSISSEARRASRGKGSPEDFRLLARPMAIDDHRKRLPDPSSMLAVTSAQDNSGRKDVPVKDLHVVTSQHKQDNPVVVSSVSSGSDRFVTLSEMKEPLGMAIPTPKNVNPRDTAIMKRSEVKSTTSKLVNSLVHPPSSARIGLEVPLPEMQREKQRPITPAGRVVDRDAVPAVDGQDDLMDVQPPRQSSQPLPSRPPSTSQRDSRLPSAPARNLHQESRSHKETIRQSSGTVSLGSSLKTSAVFAGPDGSSEVKTLKGALCRVIQARRVHDRLTREERVEFILEANRLIAPPKPPSNPSCSPEELMQEIVKGPRGQARLVKHAELRKGFMARFADRDALLVEHADALRKSYMMHHEKWREHCAALDKERAKPPAPGEGPAPSGRTTRRSAATLGDAVRSDLEMEQIIASLGNEDMMDATSLSAKNAAKIPDMMAVTHAPVTYVFDDTNNLIQDPQKFYAPRTGMFDWADEEKQIFCEKFAAHPKQFGIIAESLPNKTSTQCVAYYYLHKKSQIDFRKIIAQYGPNRRRRGRRSAADKQKEKGNALLTDIRRHDAEVSANPASASTSGPRTRGRRVAASGTSASVNGTGKTAASRRDLGDTTTPTPTPDPEPRGRPRRNRVASRYAQNPDRGDEEDDGTDTEVKTTRKGRRGRKPRATMPVKDLSEEAQMHVVPETRFIDQTELTARRKSAASHTSWSEDDKNLFLRLLAQYGDDFKRIAASMPHKTTIQVTNFYKSKLAVLRLDQVAASAPKRSPTPNGPADNWHDVHRPYPGSNIMSPVPHDSISTEGQDAASPEPELEVAKPSPSRQAAPHPQPQPQSPPPPHPTGQQQVLDLRNGIIVDQRSTWFSAGSNGSGPQPPAGPLDPAGHFTGTVDLGLRMYQGIQPQVQYRPMGGPLPSLNVVLPGQGLRYGYTQEFNAYGRLPIQPSMPLGTAEPSHAPLSAHQDERVYGGHPQNAPGYSGSPIPDHYNGQPGWPSG